VIFIVISNAKLMQINDYRTINKTTTTRNFIYQISKTKQIQNDHIKTTSGRIPESQLGINTGRLRSNVSISL